MMKKLVALALVAPLLVSCTSKKGDENNEAWVKDTNG
ncbi:membrane-bound lytic murein transglycosylase MltC, partial [Enterobacter hormaechei]